MASLVERQVDVRAIEKSLLELWKSAAEASAAGEIPPVTRAAVLTLIVIVDAPGGVNRATGMIAAITEHAPCRALLVDRTADPADPPLEAFASAHCHRVGGGRQVCCEQVTIRVSPAGEELVAGLVTPLLIPDLPVYLDWPGAARWVEGIDSATPESRLFETLRAIADVTVIDTSLARDPGAILWRMAGEPRLRDLNWSRLLPWREAVADGADIPGSPVRAPGQIVIEASGDPARPMARPWLLAGWLADRLGWPFEPTDRLRVEWQPGSGAPGRINALHFEAGPARVTLTREEVLARVQRPDEHLLCREIDRRGPDPVFRRAVSMAAALAGAGRGRE